MASFCKYCGCLILNTGYCRNKDCLLGNRNAATINQIEKLSQLCGELGVDITGKDFNTLSKEKASLLIDRLIKRKVHRELYESED